MEQRRLPRSSQSLHPAVIFAALGVTFYFVAIIGVLFGGTYQSLLPTGMVLVASAVFFAPFLLTSAYAVADPRWQMRRTHFPQYLRCPVSIATGTISGQDAAIQVLLLPVSLAFAMTVIGLIWLFHI